MNRIISRLQRYLFVVVSTLLVVPTVSAQLRGGNVPWEGPLDIFQQSITGPVARWCIMIAIVACGIGLAFSEGGSVWRKALYVCLGGSIAFGVASLVATFGGTV